MSFVSKKMAWVKSMVSGRSSAPDGRPKTLEQLVAMDPPGRPDEELPTRVDHSPLRVRARVPRKGVNVAVSKRHAAVR